LEAVTRGQIRRLLINVPPRLSKSTVVSQMWPCWVWAKKPSIPFLTSAYQMSLATRDSVWSRRLIMTNWYQRNWGHVFRLTGDQNEKQNYENDQTGYRIITSVEAGAMGRGGWQVIDDPNNTAEWESDAMCQKVIDWYADVMVSRLNDLKTDPIVVVQQRTGPKDLSGYLLERGGYDHLCLPQEYDGRRIVTSLGWSDPRTEPGQLICEGRWGAGEIADVKKSRRTYQAQHQQDPVSSTDALFKREYWRYWEPRDVSLGAVSVRDSQGNFREVTPVKIPVAFEQVLQSWDMAFKGLDSSDFVVGQPWGRLGANFYLIDQTRKHMDFVETVKAVREMSAAHPYPTKLVEDKANGAAVISFLKNEIPGLVAVNPEGGKEARANAIASYVEAGNVFLPHPRLYAWVEEFIAEAEAFPRGGRHDDSVDAMTQALRRMGDSIANAAAPEFRVMPRPGEPEAACHVMPAGRFAEEVQPWHRRFVAVYCGDTAAALWFAEMPSGSLRVYREADFGRTPAVEVGRRIALLSVPDCVQIARCAKKRHHPRFDIFVNAEAYQAPVGTAPSAALLASGIRSFVPDDLDWEERESTKAAVQAAQLSLSRMQCEADTAFEKLREKLVFAPPVHAAAEFDRKKAFELAGKDLRLYNAYSDAVDGIVRGEWPKIKFSQTPALCREIAAAMSGEKEYEPLIQALLIGVSVPAIPVPVRHAPQPKKRNEPLAGGLRLGGRFRRTA
jgi:predicted phage terminase large subunit-like protein